MKDSIKNPIQEYFHHHPRDLRLAMIFIAIGVILNYSPSILREIDVLARIEVLNDLSVAIESETIGHPKTTFLEPETVSSKLDRFDNQKKDAQDEAHSPTTILNNLNPNNVRYETLIQLGLSGSVARNWVKYLHAGGKFYRSSDLEKIYGLESRDAQELAPYFHWKSTVKKRKFHSISKLDINSAEIDEWKSLPGIGEILSKRIVKFRTNLGGFYKISQVAETYGLSDSTFQKIRPYLSLQTPIRYLDFNNLSEEALSSHPNISKKEAHIITLYRNEHGPYSSPVDVLKTAIVDSNWLNRLNPYLKEWEN
jgi:DNA uptake protein ComE-like DNA-binding protein